MYLQQNLLLKQNRRQPSSLDLYMDSVTISANFLSVPFVDS
jgi:hypothetical protein